MRFRIPSATRLLLLLPVLLLAGCQSVAFYAQAVHGQASLLARRTPIDRLLAAADTPPALKTELVRVQRIRAFAMQQLHLPAQAAYDSYVELGRPYPVWAVMAAPEFSLDAKTWCYWFVGCLDYRGFFSAQAAERYAAYLRGRGLDVYVGGAPAYSTLGLFRDPVLSSFVHDPEVAVAELLFRELAHRALFVPGDTTFNESFAVVVAEAGVGRYAATFGLDVAELAAAQSDRAAFVAFVQGYRDRLRQLYASGETPEAMRRDRAAVYGDMAQQYALRQAAWQRTGTYDGWFASPNNAKLNTIGVYYDLVPAFRRLLQQEGGNMDRFVEACRALARLDKTTRRLRLDALRPERHD